MPYKESAGQQSHAPECNALVTEEPDVLIGHVRICGGPGGQPLGLPGIRNDVNHSLTVAGRRTARAGITGCTREVQLALR